MEKPAKLRGHLLHLVATGGDPAVVLEGSGVSFAEIDALTPLPVEKNAELLDLLAARTPDDFAIQCGLATRFLNMGILGYRLLNCATVRELLETWNEYSIVIGYPLESVLHVLDDSWTLEFRPRYGLTPRALRFCMETTLIGSLRSVHTISGHYIEPTGIGFPFPAPDDIKRYAPLVPTPLHFDCELGFVSGRRCDIDLRLVTVDVEARALSDEYCRNALARISSQRTVSERVRACFARSPDHLPSAREAAALLRMSLRTLQRNLKDEGASFYELVDSFRHEQAVALLEQGKDLKTVAYLLGFGDVHSFRRSFRLRTGLTPTQWRRQSGSVAAH